MKPSERIIEIFRGTSGNFIRVCGVDCTPFQFAVLQYLDEQAEKSKREFSCYKHNKAGFGECPDCENPK